MVLERLLHGSPPRRVRHPRSAAQVAGSGHVHGLSQSVAAPAYPNSVKVRFSTETSSAYTRKRTVNTPVAVEYDATVVAHDMDKLAAFEHWVAQAVAPGLPDTVESHHTPAAASVNNVCMQVLKK